jgi:hypothetical protein
LFEASSAFTVILNDVPAATLAEEGVNENCVATAEALTLIELDMPVIDAVAVSLAVTVWLPAVFNVTENVPVPFVSFESAGNAAWLSVLVKCTVPE